MWASSVCYFKNWLKYFFSVKLAVRFVFLALSQSNIIYPVCHLSKLSLRFSCDFELRNKCNVYFPSIKATNPMKWNCFAAYKFPLVFDRYIWEKWNRPSKGILEVEFFTVEIIRALIDLIKVNISKVLLRQGLRFNYSIIITFALLRWSKLPTLYGWVTLTSGVVKLRVFVLEVWHYI